MQKRYFGSKSIITPQNTQKKQQVNIDNFDLKVSEKIRMLHIYPNQNLLCKEAARFKMTQHQKRRRIVRNKCTLLHASYAQNPKASCIALMCTIEIYLRAYTHARTHARFILTQLSGAKFHLHYINHER